MESFNFYPQDVSQQKLQSEDLKQGINVDKFDENLEDEVTPTREQVEMIQDAVRRVYPGIDGKSLDIEVAHALREFRVDKKGYINWRAMNIGKKLFLSLSEAQNHRCCYCHRELTDYRVRKGKVANLSGTIEHVIKKSEGGSDHHDNLVVACYECNTKRN